MKKTLILAVLSTVALAVVCASFALQDKKPAAPAGKGADEAAMAATKPGPAHAQLLKKVGDWTTATKTTMGPAQPMMQTIGTAKITSAFGGRFIHEDNTGTMMGTAYIGARLTGYNNGSKHYESAWIYTLSTGIMYMTGTSKDDGKTIDWTATYDNESGAKQTVQIVTKTIDDDHFTVTMHGKNPDGSEGPTMETAYTRAR